MVAFEPVIDELYEAALASERWPRAIEHVTRLCRARSAVLVMADAVSGEIAFSDEVGLDAAWQTAYLSDLRRDDLRLDDLLSHPAGTVRTDTMIGRYQAYRESRAYRELYAKLGTEHAMGAIAYCSGRYSFGLRLFRSCGDGPFGTREIAGYQRLLPHLSRCLRLRHHLADSSRRWQALAKSLDALPWPFLLLDEEAEPVVGNAAAAVPWAAGSVHGLRRHVAGAFRRYRTTGDGLSRVSAGRTAGTSTGDGPDLAIQVLDLADDGGERTGALYALIWPDGRSTAASLDPQSLRQRYGLTPTEARVLKMLLTGGRLAESRARLGIGKETARTHLSRIFAKTGTHRQVDLVQLVLKDASDSGGF